MNLLTTAEAAASLGLARSYIIAAIRRGQLRAEKIGRDWLITPKDLAAWNSRRKPTGYPAGRPRK